MIVGRGPGAPSVTPGMAFTLARRAMPEPQACDLAAIRRTDAIIDLLANRRLRRPSVLHDPAVLLLGALADDVDTELATVGQDQPADVGRAPTGADRGRPAAADWTRAAAAAAVLATVAGAATTAGVMLTALLLRYARDGGSPPAAPWWAGPGGRGPRGGRGRCT